MRDQNVFRGVQVAGLGLGVLLLMGSGCDSQTDGFTAEEWKRVKLIEPLATAMPSNPIDDRADDEDVARLGWKLFFEKDFSEAITVAGPAGNVGDVGKVACVTCHDTKYFSDSRAPQLSHGRTWQSRNTGEMVNLGWYQWTLWTGTFDSMMGHGSNVWSTSATPLAQAHFVYKKYRDDYNALFPDTPLDPALDPAAPDAARFPLTGGAKASPTAADGPFEKMAKADQWKIHQIRANLGKIFDAYPRKLTTPHSKFAQYVSGENRTEASFSPHAKNGLRLFIGKASCIDCHNGPLLSDNQFHNVGVPTAPVFPPGSTTKPVAQDRGRAATLASLLNTTLATVRTNTLLVRMDPTMDEVPIFTGTGQFSADPAGTLKRYMDLDAQACLPGGHSTDAVAAICGNIFKAPRDANPDKTPPDLGDPGDPRFPLCVQANSDLGLCASLDPTGAIVANFDPIYEGAFRTPQLINVAETGPYFHTGEFPTLRDVVWHYNNGGGALGTYAGTKSPRIKPLGLTDSEMDDLVEFLKTLTGDPPDPIWACNPLLGPPAGCGPPGAGATGGATGAGGGAGKGAGGASGAAGGSAGHGGGAGGQGGTTAASTGGAPSTGGSVASTGGSVASTGGASTGGASVDGGSAGEGGGPI